MPNLRIAVISPLILASLIGIVGCQKQDGASEQGKKNESTKDNTPTTTGNSGTVPKKDPKVASLGEIRGRVLFDGSWKPARLTAGIQGKTTDGKRIGNSAGTNFGEDLGGYVECTTFAPQITRLEKKKDNLEFSHTNLPPGNYWVMIVRNDIVSAWSPQQLLPNESLIADLKLPGKTGDVEIKNVPGKDDRVSVIVIPNGFPANDVDAEFRCSFFADKSPDGLIRLPGVTVGKYELRIAGIKKTITVEADKTVTVDWKK